jgi:hypothetical protein
MWKTKSVGRCMKYDMDLKDRKHFKDQCATNGYAKEEIKIN